MSSFTIHELDPALDSRLTERASREGLSKNQLIKELLAQASGLPGGKGYADDYREFCGAWTAAEKAAFDAAQADNERVDAEDWRP